MPSACFQCVESLVITIGAINQNKIKIGSLAFGSLESLFFIWNGERQMITSKEVL